jgi:RNA polymerase sigma factor (sigma-70 family)
MEQSLTLLIEGCKKNNKNCQKQLYELYKKRMFLICLSYMKHHEDAEDCLQDGFINVFQKINTFNNIGPFEGWMRKIFINNCLNAIKKNKIENSKEILISEIVDTKIDFDLKIDIKNLFKHLNKLSDITKEIFYLHAYEGYELSKLANAYNLNDSACRCRYMRSRKIIHKTYNTLESFNLIS